MMFSHLKNHRKEIAASLAIFILCFGGYLANLPFDFQRNLETHRTRRLMTSSDLTPNTFMPYLILKYKTLDFTPILKEVKQFDNLMVDPYYLHNTGTKYVSVYPLITGLSGLPVYILPILMNKIPNIDTHLNILKVLVLGRITASFYTAVSCVIFYWILDLADRDGKKWWKLVFTFFYAFGTASWSISSRGMWQHTISQLLISILVLLLLIGLNNKKYLPWTGLILGLAALTRPTNIIFAVIITLYIWREHREQFKLFVALALPEAVFLPLYNYFTFGSPFVEGYAARNDMAWSTPFSVSIPGFLLSPARSFLFISPPLVLSYYGIYKFLVKKLKSHQEKLLSYLGVSFMLSLLLLAKWWGWAGADGFGYRMLTEFLPVAGLLAYLVSMKWTRKWKIVLIIFMVYSVYVHGNAVIFRKGRCAYEHNWSFYCLAPPKEAPEY